MNRTPDMIGSNGKSYIVTLVFRNYFGHKFDVDTTTVVGIWDGLNECFYEKNTGKKILQNDIVSITEIK